MIEWDVDARKQDFGTLRDANGEEILEAVRAHWDSGLVVKFQRDLNGLYVIKDGDIAEEEFLYPAPLTWEPRKNDTR